MEKKYQCVDCGRTFNAKVAHNCKSRFVKENLKFADLRKFKTGNYVATRDGKVGIITKNGLWCFSKNQYIYPFDRYACDVQIEAMDHYLKEDGKYFNKETFTIDDIIPKPKFKVGDKVRIKSDFLQSSIGQFLNSPEINDFQILSIINNGIKCHIVNNIKRIGLIVECETLERVGSEKDSLDNVTVSSFMAESMMYNPHSDYEDHTESILFEAHKIVNGERQVDYGDKREGFENIAQLATALTGKILTPVDCCKVMMAVKLSRESYRHKRDNLVDLCGYAEILNILEDAG